MEHRLGNELRARLAKSRAVALLGPRQAGKSFLLKRLVDQEGGTFIDLDDSLVRQEVAQDPVQYLQARYKKGRLLVVDEAIKVPTVFEAAKILIDRLGSAPSHICLANSGNYLLLKRIRESLAGRVSLLFLYPFSWQECLQSASPPGLLTLIQGRLPSRTLQGRFSKTEIHRSRLERMAWGGYPTPTLLGDEQERIRWADDYVRTYVYPTLVEQFKVADLSAFERCVRFVFANTANLLNVQQLAQQVGVTGPTIRNYLYQLEAMLLIERAEPYSRNPRKRILKRPKIFVVDPLLVQRPLGIHFSIEQARTTGAIGPLYESFIFSEIKKTLHNHGIFHEIFTWRTADQAEVDLVIQTSEGLFPIEIKWKRNLTSRDAKSLHSFLEDYPKAKRGFIVYPGEAITPVTSKVSAIPDSWLFGCG